MTDLDSLDISEIDFSEPSKELSQVKELEADTDLKNFRLFYPFKQLTFSCLTIEGYGEDVFINNNTQLTSDTQHLGALLRQYMRTYVFRKQKFGPELQRAFDLQDEELSSEHEIHLAILQYRIALQNIFQDIANKKAIQMLIHTLNNSIYIYYDYKDTMFHIFGETRILQDLNKRLNSIDSLEPIIFKSDESIQMENLNELQNYDEVVNLKMDKILEYLKTDCPIQASGAYQLPEIVSNRQFYFNQVEFPLINQNKTITGVFLEEHVTQLLQKVIYHKDLLQFTIECQPVYMMHCMTQRDDIINAFIETAQPRKFTHMKGDIKEIILDIYEKTVKLIIQ